MKKKFLLILIVFVCSFYSINVKAYVIEKCPTDYDTLVCKYEWKKDDSHVYEYEIQRDSTTKAWRFTGLNRFGPSSSTMCGDSDLSKFVSYNTSLLQIAQETGVNLLNKGECPEFTIANKKLNTYYVGSFNYFTKDVSNTKNWNKATLVESISKDEWEQKFGEVQELAKADSASDGKGTCEVSIKYKYYGNDGDNTSYFESATAILDYSTTPPTIQEKSSNGGVSITTHTVDSSFASANAITTVTGANSASCPSNLVLMCNETGINTNKFTCNSLETLGEVEATSDVQEKIDLTPVSETSTRDNLDYENEYVGKDFCIQPEVQSIIKVASLLLLILRLFVPIIIIIIGTIDLVKVVTSGDEKLISSSIKQLGARILIGLLVFLLPPIIDFFLAPFLKATSSDSGTVYSDSLVCEKCLLSPNECESVINEYKSSKGS